MVRFIFVALILRKLRHQVEINIKRMARLCRQVGCHWKVRCGSVVNMVLKEENKKLLLIGFTSFLKVKI